MPATAIILAAGRSRRFKSARPKVLHEVCGKPMLHYVLRACYEVGCRRVLVVVGHGGELVRAAFAADDRITWVEQDEQLGSGHAAMMCRPQLLDQRGDVLILAGDRPLVRPEVLRALLDAHRGEQAAATLATAVVDDPDGCGRVIRDGSGEFVAIVEQVDATAEQQAVCEIFPSHYCVRAQDLCEALSKLGNDNRSGEYRLTDIFAILRGEGKKVVAVQAVPAEDAIGINTRQQLAEVDAIMQARIHQRLRDCGVTIVSSETTYIESGATIGIDSIIRPFSFIGRDAGIGSHCVIGPFAMVPADAIVPEGTTIVSDLRFEV